MWYNYKQLATYLIRRLRFISDLSKDVAQLFFGVCVAEIFTKSDTQWKFFVVSFLLALVCVAVGIISFKTQHG